MDDFAVLDDVLLLEGVVARLCHPAETEDHLTQIEKGD